MLWQFWIVKKFLQNKNVLFVSGSLEELEKAPFCNKKTKSEMITCWFLICHVPWAYHNHRSYSRGTDWRRNGWETSESQLLITWTFIDPSSFCGNATSGTPPSPPSRAAALAIQSGTLTLAVTRRGDLAPWRRGMDARSWRGFSTSRTPPRGAAPPPTIAPLSLFLKKIIHLFTFPNPVPDVMHFHSLASACNVFIFSAAFQGSLVFLCAPNR